MNKQLVFIAVIVGTCFLSGGGIVAQDQPSPSTKQDALPGNSAQGGISQVSSDRDLELLRKDVRSLKKQIIAANMGLTDVQAEKFWPVYDLYTAEGSKSTIRRSL